MDSITLEQAKKMVVKAGFSVSHGASWEDETHVYAFSEEGEREFFGHPKHTVCFDKVTGWLTETGQPETNLKRQVIENV